MSTSVFWKGMVQLTSAIAAGRTRVAGSATEPTAVVLQQRRQDEHGHERDGRQPHRDGVAQLEPPVAAAGGTAPSELLLGEVHPERREDDHEDQREEQ